MPAANVVAIVAAVVVVVAQPGRSAGFQPTGTIQGRITFEGTPPPPSIVIQDGGSQQVLYVDRSGGLGYAAVSIDAASIPDSKTVEPGSAPPATMNQRNFIFEPQVLAVRAGQTVRFTSDDSANHNVRAQDTNPANTFSISTGSGSVGPHTHVFTATGVNRPLRLSCDIHPWMAAWIYVFAHAHFALTGPDGGYRIDRVPSGRHRLAIRQPSGGLSRDVQVDVRGGETARIDVAFSPADLKLSQ